MSRDLSKLKVLMTHSKSLTPAQQNWPPLIQEAFAQLEVKRATRKTFGSIRTLCWTDHANLTRAQTSDIGMDPKLVRWVAEILMDGSEIRSLSGGSAGSVAAEVADAHWTSWVVHQDGAVTPGHHGGPVLGFEGRPAPLDY